MQERTHSRSPAQKPRYMSLSPLCFLFMASGVCWTHRLPRLPRHSALFWSLGSVLWSTCNYCHWLVTFGHGEHQAALASSGNLLQDTATTSHDHWSTHSLNSFPSVPWFYPLVFLEGMGVAIVMEPQEFPAILLSRYLTCSYGRPSYKNKLLR